MKPPPNTAATEMNESWGFGACNWERERESFGACVCLLLKKETQFLEEKKPFLKEKNSFFSLCVFVVVDGRDDCVSIWSLREKNRLKWWWCSDLGKSLWGICKSKFLIPKFIFFLFFLLLACQKLIEAENKNSIEVVVG